MSGNGTDMGSIVAMLQQLIATTQGFATAQDGMAKILGEHSRKLDRLHHDVDLLRTDVNGMKADLTGLRQAGTEYPASVGGHGFLISELEDRIRRIETHLDLPPRRRAS